MSGCETDVAWFMVEGFTGDRLRYGTQYIVQLVPFITCLSLSLLRLFGMRGLILFGRFDHSLQFIGTLGSGERLGILAVLFQVAKQRLLKILL